MQIGGLEMTQNWRLGSGVMAGVWCGADDPDLLFIQEVHAAWLATGSRWQLLMPGEEAEWDILFASDQTPPGTYRTTIYMAVNGYGQGGEVPVRMTSRPAAVGGQVGMDYGPPRLMGVHPNPFNARARVSLYLPALGQTALRLTDARGRLVRTLQAGVFAAGPRQLALDARDLPAGRYYLSLETPPGAAAMPVTILK